jgi:plasmid stability protein
MKSILVRDLHPNTLSALKRLARLHHRSLQGELHSIIEQAIKLMPETQEGQKPDLITARTNSNGSWHRGEIYGDAGR